VTQKSAFLHKPSESKDLSREKIISGPGYLVLKDSSAHCPPFGFFRSRQKELPRNSYSQGRTEQLRGYNLTDGGYYFAISDFFDLALRGSIYTNGTWIASAETNYNKQYKYSGQLAFSYANNISGHKGLPDYNKGTNYKITWTYTQNPKSRPGSRFSANVNMSSSGYDKTNSYQVADHVTTQRQSVSVTRRHGRGRRSTCRQAQTTIRTSGPGK
jgi:hypothetical protein